ncbi:protein phosphatase CheZ [Melioribacter sp. Ez-97]|uniref:protein phosphatase CheZ n=1 Tax=Melioribacter sp. Ez-97 TaxID=3423434 RepID=UPI003EDA2000
MENKLSMEQVFEKLGDLKQFFIFGQKIVPLFKKIIDFMTDIVPLLENVNNSIQDTTSKIPKAAHQINSVTSATEIATSEILDIVDSMSNDMIKIKNELSDLKNGFLNQRVALDAFAQKAAALNGEFDELKSNLSIDELEKKVISLEEVINKIELDATNITISLQVQDITAQQLASVNHLIHSVQEKLSSLLIDFNKQDGIVLPETEAPKVDPKAFNPDAKYDRSQSHQSVADQLIEQTKKQNNDNGSKASQEEIDKLFRNNG